MAKTKKTTDETTTTTTVEASSATVQSQPEPAKATTPANEAHQATTPATTTTAISKKDAVIGALDAGVTKAKDIQQWVKERHGLDVSTGTIAQVKQKHMPKDGNGKPTTHKSNGVPTIEDLKMVKRLMDGQPYDAFTAQVRIISKVAKEVGSFEKLEKCLVEMQELGMTA